MTIGISCPRRFDQVQAVLRLCRALILPEQREGDQGQNGDHQHDGSAHRQRAAASGALGLLAGGDVFPVQGNHNRAFSFSVLQPGLRLPQIIAAQQQALIAPAGEPLLGIDQQPRVQVDMFRFAAQRLQQCGQRRVEIIFRAEEKPVVTLERRVNTFLIDRVGDVGHNHRDNALAIIDCTLDFIETDF